MPQVESFPHDAAAVDGDTPATGAWNLGDQTVSAESAEDAADFGAGLFRFGLHTSANGALRRAVRGYPCW